MTGAINKDGVDFLCDLGRRITQCTDDHRESLPLSATIHFNSTLQCGRCLGYLHPHNPRGRNVAVPAFVLVFSLVFSPRDLYYRGQKKYNIKNNNNNDIFTCSFRVTNKPQSISNDAYNFPGSYSATGITN